MTEAGGMSEIMWIVLFIFLGGIVIAWIGIGGPGDIKNKFCEANPVFCGGNRTTIYSGVAYESFEALGCAITSSIKGGPDSCMSKYKNANEFTIRGDKTPLAKCYTREDLVCCDTGIFGGEYWMTPEQCKANGYTVEEGKTKENKCGELWKEGRQEAPEFTCIVENFALPQKFGTLELPVIGTEVTPEAWIQGYGDPHYLVYWQKFPQEEDTWSFKYDWRVQTAIAAVSILPVGKIIGGTVKGIFDGMKKFGAKIAANRATKEVGEEMLEWLLTLEKGYGKTAGGIGSIFTREGAKKFLVKTLAASKQALMSKEGAIKSVKYLAGSAKKGAVLSGAAYALAWAESVTQKYEERPGKLVFKIPLEAPVEYDLPDSWKGKPVFIEFTPKVRDARKQLHLASPCRLTVLPISKEAAECPAYLFNTETGYTECLKTPPDTDNPEDIIYPKRIGNLESSQFPLCQNIIEDIEFTDNPSANRFIDFFRSLKNSPVPDSLKNYYDEENDRLDVLVYNDVVYKVTDKKNFDSDKLVIGSKELDITTEKRGEKPGESWLGFSSGVIATGNVKYKNAELNVYKYCASWENDVFGEERESRETRGELAKIDCNIGIKVKNLCSNTEDDVCRKIEQINTQTPHDAIFKGIGLERSKNVNIYIASAYFEELGEDSKKVWIGGASATGDISSGRRPININKRVNYVGGSDYFISMVDSDYDKRVDRIGFYDYEEGYFNPSVELFSQEPSLFLLDTDSDGDFEIFGTPNKCKTEAIYVNYVEAKKSDTGDEYNYCVSEQGRFFAIVDDAGEILGWGLVAVGVGAAIVGTGGFAAPVIGVAGATLTAGGAISVGFASLAVSDLTEKTTGDWPEN